MRYGHFTDRSFDLPSGDTDFHIIFGSNEAGKSTALAAIEDLLFGIPMHSHYNFLHDYASMRIGGLFDNGKASLEVIRRKGNKDTLLGPEGLPLPGGDGVLMPYLSGADRSFFERMFSLDHKRLEDGGRKILEAKDDVGQMLFSAGAGIASLRERLNELCTEADELWSARRAKHRKFYIAEDKLTDAQKVLRDETLTASKWRELKRAYDTVEEACAEIDKKIKDASAERNRLNRIRRIFRNVRRKQELDGQLGELEDAILLPEDAAKTVADAEGKDAKAQTRIATLQDQLKRAETELGGLTFNEAVVQRSDDIRQLHERRIEIRGEKADLPKREAELNAAEEELRAGARELGWTETDPAALDKRIPTRNKIGAVRSLIAKKGEADAEVANCARLLGEARDANDELNTLLSTAEESADASGLAIVLKTVREQGDLSGSVRSTQQAFKSAEGIVTRRLEALKPGIADETSLTSIAVPARADVETFRERELDHKRRLREARQRTSLIGQERDAAVSVFNQTFRDEQFVTPEELQEARARRDSLWKLVKIKHVRGERIPQDQADTFEEELNDLSGAFEPALTKADALADRRFDRAEAAGRIAEIKRKIRELGISLEHAQANETALTTEGEALEAEWKVMWAEAPFAPLSAEGMLEWIDGRAAVLGAIEEREERKGAFDAIDNQVREAKDGLLAELSVLGVDVGNLIDASLNIIIQRADEEQRGLEAKADKRAQLEDDVEKAAKAVTRREGELRRANEALENWQTGWTAAVGQLGLADDTAAEAAEAQIEVIENMREAAGKMRSLRHDRIDKINRDVADFEKVAGKLIGDVAQDLKGQQAEDAILVLEARLEEAERVRDLRQKKENDVQDLTAQIDELEDERRALMASISHLKQAAKVESVEALKKVIGDSDRKQNLEQEQRELVAKLRHDGDGKSLEELEKECEDVLIDEVVARDASIEAELVDFRKQQTDAAEERSRARDAYLAVGGGDAAAQAAANKQDALAEIEEIAARYVRVRTSALLLQWAVDRYRREKQAPLLKRAGELFKVMTGNSFTNLQVTFDEQDVAHLTGLRLDGTIVPVSGMSTGTADQLYLALRIAAIEDYLERADALPFVADDLFINFDDGRAAAGFNLLAELSRKTQVLFFTHHQHLVDIAGKTLGAGARLVRLRDAKMATA